MRARTRVRHTRGAHTPEAPRRPRLETLLEPPTAKQRASRPPLNPSRPLRPAAVQVRQMQVQARRGGDSASASSSVNRAARSAQGT
eukprot:4817059-Prymnesium_polylepis.1